ncbi:glycosyltransferase domain-containing protein [Vibrio ziniensis]|uniref:DUF616 domain-containing protein n=1 Tax=Vibrio ziniensis TaxID=2711221 RepID=A0A6G7CLI8_9VIBR|nr:glycosyltransferase domain-containing protein [Vibrio ziniensis]QIH42969.1 DUF616 domain-containing protein [Vibrio ziniensis]
MKNKTVIYTAIFGNYDKVVNLTAVDKEKFDYILFSDSDNVLYSPPWELKTIKNMDFDSNVKKNRYIKFFPHYFLNEYKDSIYIDGNVDIVKSLDSFMEASICYDMQCYSHPHRENVIQEMAANLWMRRLPDESIPKLSELIVDFQNSGYIFDGLYEANVIYRKHNDNVDNLMKLWWELFSCGVQRDQIYLPFALWKCKDFISFNALEKNNSRMKGADFYCYKHRNISFSDLLIKLKRKYRMLTTDIDYWVKKIDG